MPPEPPVIGPGLAPTSETSRKAPLNFLHIKPGERQHVTILSETWTGGITHYARGRMKLHTAKDCPWCGSGQAPRWYGWLHVWTERTARQWILQLASSQHGQLVAALDKWSTLRGLEAEITRQGTALNTPVTITITGPPDPRLHHPEPADIAAILTVYMDWTTGEGAEQQTPAPLKGRKHT